VGERYPISQILAGVGRV